VENAHGHYRAHGWVPAMCVRDLAGALYFGPTPVDAAVERCRELLEEADHGGAAGVRTYLAGLEAMKGRFAEARETAAHARRNHEELAWTVSISTTWAPVAASIEVLAGDIAAAVGTLRESCSVLERMGDRGALATQAGRLAMLLARRGLVDEAERWSAISRRCAAPDDLPAQLEWRTAQALLLARRDLLAEGEKLAREAARLAESTDALNRRGDVMLALGEVLRLAGRADEAGECVETAIAVYERKGNVAAAGSARAKLGEPAPA
jgi:tetratricopeptide (TPR) repeat protein